MESQTRTWAAIIVLGVVLIVSMVLDMRARAWTVRRLRAQGEMIFQLEAEATVRRGGLPRSVPERPVGGP